MNDHDVKVLVGDIIQEKYDSNRLMSHNYHVRSTGNHKSDVYSHFNLLYNAGFCPINDSLNRIQSRGSTPSRGLAISGTMY